MYHKYTTKMASLSQEHETPDPLFNRLHKEFHFVIDICASHENHKLPIYYTKEDDCFTKDWDKTGWINPEFIRVKKFAKKAYEDSKKFGSTLVMICMVKSNTNWWRDYVMDAKEVRFINQKVQFKGTSQGLRFPCAIVIFAPHEGITKWLVLEQTT